MDKNTRRQDTFTHIKILFLAPRINVCLDTLALRVSHCAVSLTRWLLARLLVTHSMTASSPSATVTWPLVLTKLTSAPPDPDNGPGEVRGARDPAMVSRVRPSRPSLSVIRGRRERESEMVMS